MPQPSHREQPSIKNPLGRSSLEAYGAVLIAIVIAVLPMTWWLMAILFMAALCLVADLCFRASFLFRFPIWQRAILFLFIGSIVTGVGFYRCVSEYNAGTVGHLIISKVDGPFIDDNGIMSINVIIKNNGDSTAFGMRRFSGTYYDVNPVDIDELDRLFSALKTMKKSDTKSSLDAGEEMLFSVYSLHDWRDKYKQAIDGQAYIFFAAIELYKDMHTTNGYVYEKHMCFHLAAGKVLFRCSGHNENIVVKE